MCEQGMPYDPQSCNIVVVAGGSWRFARAGVTPWKGGLLLTGIAAPAAFVGGMIPIDRDAFMLLLGASLVLTGVTMLIPVSEAQSEDPHPVARAMPLIAAPHSPESAW